MLFLPRVSLREIANRWRSELSEPSEHCCLPHWSGEYPVIFDVDDKAVNPWDEGQLPEHLNV